jgi:homoserine O-succinyltransferase/O-acetyltransferase
MPLLLDTARFGSPSELLGSNCLTIGFVNNMPDTAVVATERQFIDLVRAASADAVVRLKLFAISEVPRSELVQSEFIERYRDISELWDTRLDGLIVTGTEPRAAALADEPYWPELAKLVAWAQENTISTIWSCLAAHAAVLQADGIERRRLDDKLFGVFDHDVVAEHPLLNGLPSRLAVPHSRYHDLPEAALTSCGYRVLTNSGVTGADTFVREEDGSSLFVFFQGHPEYEADTLAREYRRDIGRFLRGEREHFPATPQNYFNDEATALAEDFRARAVARAIDVRRESLLSDFPMTALQRGLENTWRQPANGIYRNWLEYLKARKAQRRTLSSKGRGSPGDAMRIGKVRSAVGGSTAG